MKFKTPTSSVLYTLEQAIKEYRKLCQKNIDDMVDDMTVDQCLVLIILNDQISLSQKEISELIFKDTASVARMVELMVQKGYLTRTMHKTDRRKFQLGITAKGKKALVKLSPIVEQNRSTALRGVSAAEIAQLYTTLQKLISNCQSS